MRWIVYAVWVLCLLVIVAGIILGIALAKEISVSGLKAVVNGIWNGPK